MVRHVPNPLPKGAVAAGDREDGVSTKGTCLAKDIHCESVDGEPRVLRTPPKEARTDDLALTDDLDIAGEPGRPGARQFTNAVEANADRTLVDDTQGLPGYGLRGDHA